MWNGEEMSYPVTVYRRRRTQRKVKPQREGERKSRRKLGLAPEFSQQDLPVRTRRAKVVEPAVVEVAVPELPRNPEAVEEPIPVMEVPVITVEDFDAVVDVVEVVPVMEVPIIIVEDFDAVVDVVEVVPDVEVPVVEVTDGAVEEVLDVPVPTAVEVPGPVVHVSDSLEVINISAEVSSGPLVSVPGSSDASAFSSVVPPPRRRFGRFASGLRMFANVVLTLGRLIVLDV